MSLHLMQWFKRLKPSTGHMRLLLATCVFLLAYPLLFIAFFSDTKDKQGSQAPGHPIVVQPTVIIDKSELTSDDKGLYLIETVEYYKKNHHLADERTTLDPKIIRFIKHPPLKQELQLYTRYNKVKEDFNKIRMYRKKLDELENKRQGRNQTADKITAHKDKYLELEAELFYQLEKIVYFAQQSYLNWEMFQGKDTEDIKYVEKLTVQQSEQAADLFEDFNRALNQYTTDRLSRY